MIKHLSIPSLLREGKKTALLAVPLIIGQISQMLMIIADTKMVGKVGVTELAALTFGSAIFSVPFVFGIGLTTSISVLSSGASGQKDHARARAICRNGFYLSIAAGTLLFLLSTLLIPFLHIFNQPPEVTAAAPPYLFLVLISLIPVLGSIGLKNHADSIGRVWPAFFIFLGGVILNVILNQLFIFTLDYGLTGAGWATLISRIAILLGMLLWFKIAPSLHDLTPRRWIQKPDPKTLRRLLALGIPASFHLLAEVGAFSAAGIFVGLYGEIPLASHQVALTTAGTLFMVPLGIAIALTMRMGNVAGAKEKHRYPAIIFSGWALTLFFVALTSTFCALLRYDIAALYVSEPEVIAIAGSFLAIVAVFQIFDAIQVVSGGILRGLEDVTVPAWTAFISYWIFGIPAGLLLANRFGLGAAGIWWGLAIGLAIAAIILTARVFKIAR
ncbi:MAG: MATE family efflux transporter [Verrucomicrobiaceae bacterium]